MNLPATPSWAKALPALVLALAPGFLAAQETVQLENDTIRTFYLLPIAEKVEGMEPITGMVVRWTMTDLAGTKGEVELTQLGGTVELDPSRDKTEPIILEPGGCVYFSPSRYSWRGPGLATFRLWSENPAATSGQAMGLEAQPDVEDLQAMVRITVAPVVRARTRDGKAGGLTQPLLSKQVDRTRMHAHFEEDSKTHGLAFEPQKDGRRWVLRGIGAASCPCAIL